MRSFDDRDTHVIRLVGELDLETADDVEHELRRVELTCVSVIAIDLRELTFIDSTGIRLILRAERRSSRGGNRLVLVRGADAVQRLFEICDLADRLPFVDQLPAHDPVLRSAGSDGSTDRGSLHAGRAATNRRVDQGTLAGAVLQLRSRPRPGSSINRQP